MAGYKYKIKRSLIMKIAFVYLLAVLLFSGGFFMPVKDSLAVTEADGPGKIGKASAECPYLAGQISADEGKTDKKDEESSKDKKTAGCPYLSSGKSSVSVECPYTGKNGSGKCPYTGKTKAGSSSECPYSGKSGSDAECPYTGKNGQSDVKSAPKVNKQFETKNS